MYSNNNNNSCCSCRHASTRDGQVALDAEMTMLATLLRADAPLVVVHGSTHSHLGALYWRMPDVVQRVWRWPSSSSSSPQPQPLPPQRPVVSLVTLVPHTPWRRLRAARVGLASATGCLDMRDNGDAQLRWPQHARATAAALPHVGAHRQVDVCNDGLLRARLSRCKVPAHTAYDADAAIAATTATTTTTTTTDDARAWRLRTAAMHDDADDTRTQRVSPSLPPPLHRHLITQFVGSEVELALTLRAWRAHTSSCSADDRCGDGVHQLVVFVNTDVASDALRRQLRPQPPRDTDTTTTTTTNNTTTTTTMTARHTTRDGGDDTASRVTRVTFDTRVRTTMRSFVHAYAQRSATRDDDGAGKNDDSDDKQHDEGNAVQCAALCLASYAHVSSDRVVDGALVTPCCRRRRCARQPQQHTAAAAVANATAHVWSCVTCSMSALRVRQQQQQSRAAAAPPASRTRHTPCMARQRHGKTAASGDDDVSWVCADDAAVEALRQRARERNVDNAAARRSLAASSSSSLSSSSCVTHCSYYPFVGAISPLLAHAACVSDVFVLEYTAHDDVDDDDDGGGAVSTRHAGTTDSNNNDDNDQRSNDRDGRNRSYSTRSHPYYVDYTCVMRSSSIYEAVTAAEAALRAATRTYMRYRDARARARLLRAVVQLTRATAPSRLTLSWPVDDANDAHDVRFAFCLSYEHDNTHWPLERARVKWTFLRAPPRRPHTKATAVLHTDAATSPQRGGGGGVVTVDASTMEWQLRYTLHVLSRHGWTLVYQDDHNTWCRATCARADTTDTTTATAAANTSVHDYATYATATSALRRRVRRLLDAAATPSVQHKQEQRARDVATLRQRSMLWQAALVSATEGVHLYIGMRVYVDVSLHDASPSQQQQQDEHEQTYRCGVVVDFQPPPSPLPPYTCPAFAQWWQLRQQQQQQNNSSNNNKSGGGDGDNGCDVAWRPSLPSYVYTMQQARWPVVELTCGRRVHVLPRLLRCVHVDYPVICFVSHAQQRQHDRCDDAAAAATAEAASDAELLSSLRLPYVNVSWSIDVGGDGDDKAANKHVALFALPLHLVRHETAMTLYTTTTLSPRSRAAALYADDKAATTAATATTTTRQLWRRLHAGCDTHRGTTAQQRRVVVAHTFDNCPQALRCVMHCLRDACAHRHA